MIDKLAAVPRTRLRQRVGTLETTELRQLGRAIVVFLGLGGTTGR